MSRARDYRAVVFDFFGTLTEAVQRGPDHDRVAAILGCPAPAFARALDETFTDRSTGCSVMRSDRSLSSPDWPVERPTCAALRAAYAARIDAVRADTRLRPTPSRCCGRRSVSLSTR